MKNKRLHIENGMNRMSLCNKKFKIPDKRRAYSNYDVTCKKCQNKLIKLGVPETYWTVHVKCPTCDGKGLINEKTLHEITEYKRIWRYSKEK